MTHAIRLPHTRRFPTRTEATGLLLLTFPVLIQLPYSLLITHFAYPAVLRMPAAMILQRYAETSQREPLTLIWYVFAMAIVPLLLAICLLPRSVPGAEHSTWLRAATPLGVASALVQIIGLLRWVILVPLLAQRWMDASDPSTKTAIELVFGAQNELFGVLLGEYLGQMLLGLWTFGVAVGMPVSSLGSRVQRILGVLAGSMFLAGSFGSLSKVFPALAGLEPVATVAFLVWSVWCCLLGLVLIRDSRAATGRMMNPDA